MMTSSIAVAVDVAGPADRTTRVIAGVDSREHETARAVAAAVGVELREREHGGEALRRPEDDVVRSRAGRPPGFASLAPMMTSPIPSPSTSPAQLTDDPIV
jgi:hypothetical protein